MFSFEPVIEGMTFAATAGLVELVGARPDEFQKTASSAVASVMTVLHVWGWLSFGN